MLVDDTPLPEGLDSRLREQLGFLVEIDRLKTVVRLVLVHDLVEIYAGEARGWARRS